MFPQVVTYTLSEGLDTNELFDHAEHSRALAICDRVEHLVDLGRRFNFELDWAGRGKMICSVGPCLIADLEAEIAVPIWTPGVYGLGLHKSGEGFVEPCALPPTQSHQVAEPLMGDFMSNHLQTPLQLCLCRLALIDDQVGVPIGDEPDVLHRSRREVGNRDVVELVTGVGDVVVIGQVLESPDCRVQGVAGEVKVPLRSDDSGGNAASVDGFGRFERADDEREQISRHLHRLGKLEFDPAVIQGSPAQLSCIGVRLEAAGSDDRGLEGGLEVGLVPAWKHPSGVGCLTL